MIIRHDSADLPSGKVGKDNRSTNRQGISSNIERTTKLFSHLTPRIWWCWLVGRSVGECKRGREIDPPNSEASRDDSSRVGNKRTSNRILFTSSRVSSHVANRDWIGRNIHQDGSAIAWEEGRRGEGNGRRDTQRQALRGTVGANFVTKLA